MIQSLRLSYTLTPEDYAVFLKRAYRPFVDGARKRYYVGYAAWFILWAYAAVVTVIYLQNIFIACLITALAVMQFRHASSFAQELRSIYEQSAFPAGGRHLELNIDEAGLTELDSGITSHAPWTSVTRAEIRGGLLIIMLASGLSAIIPAKAMATTEWTLEQLREEIQGRLTPMLSQ